MLSLNDLATKINNKQQVSNTNSSHSLGQFYFDPYLMSFYSYQNFMNFGFIQNQNLLSSCFEQKNEKEPVGSSISFGVQNQSLNSTFVLQEKQRVELYGLNQSNNQQIGYSKPINNQISLNDDQLYEPEIHTSNKKKERRSSQSKNVPKNFAKAIILFIKKQQHLIKRLTQKYDVDFNNFYEVSMALKGKINTIAQLRSLWVQEQNQYAKIYRVLCTLYIRKYSYQHIFNSRVQDYSRHLKYQHSISQGLKKPKQFTKMKDY